MMIFSANCVLLQNMGHPRFPLAYTRGVEHFAPRLALGNAGSLFYGTFLYRGHLVLSTSTAFALHPNLVGQAKEITKEKALEGL
jgi:hypothetical protein